MSGLSEKARAFLEEPRFAVLATSRADSPPQLTVMWYALEGDELLMNTTTDRAKAANLRRNPQVSVCFEDGYNYLTIYGTAHLIDDPTIAQTDIGRLARRYHGVEKAEQMMRDQFSKQRRLTLRISVEHVVEKL